MELMEAKYENAKLLFNWVNDPVMRKNSFNSAIIKWEDHLTWFVKKLEDVNTKIYIAFFKDMPCGQIRFDKKDTNAYIDFYIDSEFRGKGLGIKLLIQGCERIFYEWSKIRSVVGEVKKNNISSRKSFLKAGFDELENENFIVYIKRRAKTNEHN